MDDNQFWFRFQCIAGAVVIVAIVSLAIYEDAQDARVLEAINAGVNPIAARCGISEVHQDVCLAWAIQNK